MLFAVMWSRNGPVSDRNAGVSKGNGVFSSLQQGSHRLQTLPPTAATWEAALSTRLLCVAVHNNICKRDVMNIQHSIVNTHDIVMI